MFHPISLNKMRIFPIFLGAAVVFFPPAGSSELQDLPQSLCQHLCPLLLSICFIPFPFPAARSDSHLPWKILDFQSDPPPAILAPGKRARFPRWCQFFQHFQIGLINIVPLEPCMSKVRKILAFPIGRAWNSVGAEVAITQKSSEEGRGLAPSGSRKTKLPPCQCKTLWNILFSPSQNRFNEFLVVNSCLLGPTQRAPIPRRCCSIPEPAHVGIYLQQHPLTGSEIAAQARLFFSPILQNLIHAKP